MAHISNDELLCQSCMKECKTSSLVQKIKCCGQCFQYCICVSDEKTKKPESDERKIDETGLDPEEIEIVGLSYFLVLTCCVCSEFIFLC